MPHDIFSQEYETIRTTLRECVFADDAKTMIRDLKRVAIEGGPDPSGAAALDRLRNHCERGFFQRVFGSAKNKEADGILALAGDGIGVDRKAATLKALRHLHLMTKFGGHSLWVMSLPKSYRKWPSDQLSGKSGESLANLLRDKDGRFSNKQMRDLTSASQEATKWANKAGAICTATRGVGAERAGTLIKRWFADENTTDEEITGMAATLAAGYKKIAVAAGGKRMVLTDNPVDRGTPDENSNAYVWYDQLNVVYIEGGFFGEAGDPLSGLKNWTRILVHELSHSQVKTEDHAYRWQGLKPKSNSFPSAKAIENADSWALFAADANGELTQRDREYCLK